MSLSNGRALVPCILAVLSRSELALAEPAFPGQNEPHEEAPHFETLVQARRPLRAASSSSIGAREFSLRPLLRAADLLSAAPGLFVAQHAGGGKAHQYNAVAVRVTWTCRFRLDS